MRRVLKVCLILCFAAPFVHGAKPDPVWKLGKIVNADRARYFAGILHDSHSSTSQNGSLNASANSTSVGGYTNTNVNGSYSGRSDTNTSGFDAPIYKVYDNLIIEGDDAIYVTQERLRWRWSKGAHVAVNSEIKYFVSGRKLHVLDEDGKEHTIDVVKEIRKNPQDVVVNSDAPSVLPPVTASAPTSNAMQPTIEITSVPEGADILVDGDFVGNTPSTVTVTAGSHEIKVSKKGFEQWERNVKATSPHVRLAAILDSSRQTVSK